MEVSGRFEAITPFNAKVLQGVFYTVIAIRLFDDCEADGEDVYQRYYAPMGLSNAEYSVDKSSGAAIVTLRDPDGNTVELPDTYIASYPKMGAAKYQHVVLAVSLGPIPETVQLDTLIAKIGEVTSDVIGVENRVQIAAAPSSGVITDEEHEALETARIARIKTRTSTAADLVRSNAQLVIMQERITVYEQILRANGLMPN